MTIDQYIVVEYSVVQNCFHLETVKDILAKTIKHDGEVFGASEIECGNYKTLNLDCAKKACREYLEAIRDINDIITYDDVNQRGC